MTHKSSELLNYIAFLHFKSIKRVCERVCATDRSEHSKVDAASKIPSIVSLIINSCK